MSNWDMYGEDSKVDLKVILGDILKNTTDSRVYRRFEVILEEIERLEEKIKELKNLNSDLESDKLSIEEKYTSLYDRISDALKE